MENIYLFMGAFLISFTLSFLLTPWAGKVAKWFSVMDLPIKQLSGREGNFGSRMNEGMKPRLGGLSVAIAIGLSILALRPELQIGNGIVIGFLVIVIVGILDDKFGLNGKYQLFFQILAAVLVVVSGTSIPETIYFVGSPISLNWFTQYVEVGSFAYNFIFPAHFITVIWIVGVINVINWVGGVDGLNISISSVIAFTMLLFAISFSNIPLAILILIFLGANMGLFPFNYYPSKIIPGSSSEYINGYFLAVFALIGPTGWTGTLIILALPIIDAIIVVIIRIRTHPEVTRNPLKILSINDKNHLHHRLLEIGYSRKAVMGIEVMITVIICTIALAFGIDTGQGNLSNQLIVAFAVSMAFLITIFTLVFALKQRANNKSRVIQAIAPDEAKKEAIVKVILDEDEDKSDYERFAY